MRRLVTTLTLLAGALVAACGGPATTPVPSAAPSAVATSTPSAQGGPTDTLPTLPAGWARYESPGAFTIGVPATWLVMTSTERNDAAAETALKARYPTYSAKIDTALVQMRDQDLLVLAGDINGDATVSAASMFIKKVPGTLDLAFATSAAAAAQKQLKIGVPLTVQAMTRPAGSYCYDFAVDMAPTSMAGRQCLFPSGYYDVYVMTFLTTVAQIATYSPTVLSLCDTFAAAEAPGAAPSATQAPATITTPSPLISTKRPGAVSAETLPLPLFMPPRLEARPVVTPFLKWPGGKSQELPAIAAVAPSLTGRLIDPFVGSGAVLYAAPPGVAAWANDACPDLIGLYASAAARDDS